MSDHRANATTSPHIPETNPQFRRWTFWTGLVLTLVFAAGFFQFSLADRLMIPSEQRVNDGDQITFFAVHINPYYVFSEDFHLYVVRAKRILDRGWTDSPLCKSENEQVSYSAPLQAALMMLAVKTDGKPLPYSLFVVGVLATAWSILYLAAFRWLPTNISPLTVPVAVLLTVLFESFAGLLHPNGEFGQWPVHRGLRMATLAWTSPLLLSVVLASVNLIFRRDRPIGRTAFVALTLIALGLADMWAFLLAFSCVGVTILALGIMGLIQWRRSDRGRNNRTWIVAAGLTLAAVLALSIQQSANTPLTGDVLSRAGFGIEWHGAEFSVGESRTFHRIARIYVGALLAFSTALALTGAINVLRHPLRLRIEAEFRRPTAEQAHLLVLAAAPIIGFVLLVEALSQLGMDEYHLFQFVWRLDFVLLFCGAVVFSEIVKFLLRKLVDIPARSTHWEVILTCVFLATLLIYHNVRIYKFVSRIVASEFFLTKDEEMLRDWLREREPSLGDYSLVTASHELNYLCAYWSRADLWLPEGFPYHSAASNKEIEARMASVLHIYNATSYGWLDFNLHRHVWDQWSWGESRLLSARHGYMYYLMHRDLLREGTVAEKATTRHPGHTTPHYAELRLKHDKALANGHYMQHRAGVEAAKRIAGLLPGEAFESPLAEKPDVIVVDEVSRYLGTPDLTNYVQEFKHGNLEAWVLKRDQDISLLPSVDASD